MSVVVNDRRRSLPAVGIAYRAALDAWIRAHLDNFDVLEITVDDCIRGGKERRLAIFDLIGRIPLTAHGVELSIGTDTPLDIAYLDQIAEVVGRLRAPAFSEHLAFTGVPGREIANLLPLPRTTAVAETIIEKVRFVQSHLNVPFLLENIAYFFEWPDFEMSEAEFLNLICSETGAQLLLDIENLHLNALNHGVDPNEFLATFPSGAVQEVHLAGGAALHPANFARPFVADTHSHPVPDAALDLLQEALLHHQPAAIMLERDERFDAFDEILDDMARIRSRLADSALRESQ
jgi:uncharacterized protein